MYNRKSSSTNCYDVVQKHWEKRTSGRQTTLWTSWWLFTRQDLHKLLMQLYSWWNLLQWSTWCGVICGQCGAFCCRANYGHMNSWKMPWRLLLLTQLQVCTLRKCDGGRWDRNYSVGYAMYRNWTTSNNRETLLPSCKLDGKILALARIRLHNEMTVLWVCMRPKLILEGQKKWWVWLDFKLGS